jgi:tetratricopeptide (TPR) repeat protein
MGTISKYKTLSKAKENFSTQNYEEAMKQFASVLQTYPNSQEAYNGVILSEMALSGEGGAEALFDYYEILKDENSEEADKIMNDLLKSMDSSLEQLNDIFSDPLLDKLEFEDGILYDDFKRIVENGEEFKEIFENIMYSSKVIITQKEDFLEFLDSLIEHNFSDMALSYLENALTVYPGDEKLVKLLKKLLEKGESIEN